MNPRTVGNVAWLMGLLPVAWLAATHHRGRLFWWIASAFGISFLADFAAHWVDPWLVSLVYPISQAGIMVVLLTDYRGDAAFVLAVFLLVGMVAVLWHGTQGPDVALRIVCWGTVAALASRYPELWMRRSLLTYFGLGLFAWTVYATWPGWSSWIGYQSTRLLGLLLFCYATRPLRAPVLTLSQGTR